MACMLSPGQMGPCVLMGPAVCTSVEAGLSEISAASEITTHPSPVADLKTDISCAFAEDGYATDMLVGSGCMFMTPLPL